MSTRTEQHDNAQRQEVQDAFERFQERQRRNHQVRAEVLETLAAVLEPRVSSAPAVEGTSLLVAASAVGEVLGVTIRPPARSEDPGKAREPLEAIARASHLRIRRVLLTGTWWKHDCGPLLAYTREDHRPVALLPISATRYDLFDPIRGTRTPVHARLAPTLAPEAYTLYRPFPTTTFGALDLLRFGLRGRSKDLRMILLTGIVVTLLGMLTPQATAILINQAIPDAHRPMVLQLGLALLAAVCGQALLQLAQGFALMRQHTAAGASLQAAMWDRLLQLKASFFRHYDTGDLQARVTAISTIQQALSGATIRTLCTSVLSLLNLALMLYYSVPLALVAGAIALGACSITAGAGVLTIRQVRPLQRLEGELQGMMVQLIHGVAKIRVAGAEERAFAYWGKTYSQQRTLRQRVQYIEDSMTVVNTVLPVLAAVVLFWWTMLALQPVEAAGGRGLGTFLAFHAAFGTFIGGATSLSNTIIALLDVAPLWERARPILEAAPEVHIDNTDPGKLTGKLAVDHVTFRYQEHGPIILQGVSLHAEPGECIALVGPSGSGKSTILRLLLGLDTPESGAVYYDDRDLARLDVTAVRRQLGTVLQQSAIMAATIFENIASSGLITLEDAWDVARAAGLAEDIAAMPMGMHTLVSEGGSNLSGGQRQRLLIARALVHKPAVVLFDEATSALDNRAQAIVTASLERLRVTRVIIAHRLSTIRHADRIYVLEQGRIVQQGRFPELAQQDGLFARLMARQEV